MAAGGGVAAISGIVSGGRTGVQADDDELVRRAAGGDGAAFALIVQRHRRRLLAQVSRVLGARGRGGGGGLAEDVVQETFARAWTNAARWQNRGGGAGSYAAWLSRVAGNLAIDGLRRATPLPLDDVAEPLDPADGAEAGVLDAERTAAVRRAVAALPERQRRAVALFYDAELSNGEAAAAMGTTVGAFELLLVRARRSLRRAVAAADTGVAEAGPDGDPGARAGTGVIGTGTVRVR